MRSRDSSNALAGAVTRCVPSDEVPNALPGNSLPGNRLPENGLPGGSERGGSGAPVHLDLHVVQRAQEGLVAGEVVGHGGRQRPLQAQLRGGAGG